MAKIIKAGVEIPLGTSDPAADGVLGLVMGGVAPSGKYLAGYNSDGSPSYEDLPEVEPGGDFDLPGAIHGATADTSPVDADEIPFASSASGWVLGKFSFSTIKAWIKAWIIKGDVGLGNADNTADNAKNVLSASKLTTPRNINSQPFDGTVDLTVAAAAGTLTGDTINAGVLNSSLTRVGTISIGVWQGSIIAPGYLGTGASPATKFLRGDGTWQTISGGGDALTSNNLSQFAATTSAQLRSVMSDETGTGFAYFQGGDIGTPSAGNLANCIGLPVSGVGMSTAGQSMAALATPGVPAMIQISTAGVASLRSLNNVATDINAARLSTANAFSSTNSFSALVTLTGGLTINGGTITLDATAKQDFRNAADIARTDYDPYTTTAFTITTASTLRYGKTVAHTNAAASVCTLNMANTGVADTNWKVGDIVKIIVSGTGRVTFAGSGGTLTQVFSGTGVVSPTGVGTGNKGAYFMAEVLSVVPGTSMTIMVSGGVPL